MQNTRRHHLFPYVLAIESPLLDFQEAKNGIAGFMLVDVTRRYMGRLFWSRVLAERGPESDRWWWEFFIKQCNRQAAGVGVALVCSGTSSATGGSTTDLKGNRSASHNIEGDEELGEAAAMAAAIAAVASAAASEEASEAAAAEEAEMAAFTAAEPMPTTVS